MSHSSQVIGTFLALIAVAIGATRPLTAHAETFNVPCQTSELMNAVIDANDNEEEDFLWLAAACTYGPQSTLVIAADTGHPVTIYGNAAAIRGNHGHTVFAVNPGATLYLHQVAVIDGIDTLGGGILNEGFLALTDSIVTGNEASFGAGILNRGTLRLTNSSVSGNTALYGGGIFNEGGRLTLTRSTLSGNGAREGGGIFASVNGTVRLANSTVSGNRATAGSGGGVYVFNGEVELSQSTFSGNSATVSGGGIYVLSAGTLKLDNSILANSTSGGDCFRLFGSVVTPSGGNLIEDDSCNVAGALSGDPLLGELEGDPGHHPLLKESPAIDAANAASCPNVDQRGALRPQDGNKDKIAACDLGAYERSKKKKKGTK